MTARRKRVLVSMMAAGSVLIMALLLVPIDESRAHSDNTGGTCQGSGSCHPLTSTQFLTVTGFPTGGYTPGGLYRITVTITDTNGAGRYNMNFIVSAGTVSNGDSNVRIISDTQAASSEDTVTTWSFDWTAPTSGTVTADAWGVDGSGNGKDDPYDHRTLSTATIPEFSTLIIPIAGALGLLLAIGYHRRGKHSPK